MTIRNDPPQWESRSTRDETPLWFALLFSMMLVPIGLGFTLVGLCAWFPRTMDKLYKRYKGPIDTLMYRLSGPWGWEEPRRRTEPRGLEEARRRAESISRDESAGWGEPRPWDASTGWEETRR